MRSGGFGNMSPSLGSWRSKEGGDARLGDKSGSEGIAGQGAVEDGGGATSGGGSSDDRSLGVGIDADREAQATGAQARSVQGDRARAAEELSGADGAAAVRGGSSGGLRGMLQSRARLREGSAQDDTPGAGGALRDASGASGPGGLRDVSAAVGPAARAAGGSGPLATAVAGVLPVADDGDGHDGTGAFVRVLRRGSVGTAVRPDEGGGDRGPPSEGRRPAAERGVSPLRGALGLQDPRLQAVSGADQGQGGAPGELRAAELPLRPDVRERRRPERAGPGMAARRGQRAVSRGAGRESP